MAHLLLLAVIALAAWTVLAFLLGPLIGRHLRRTRPATSPNRPTTGSPR